MVDLTLGRTILSSVRRLIILYQMGLDTNKHTNFRKLRRKYMSKTVFSI